MAKKLTTEEFIQKAREKHGDRYDYSKVEYGGANGLITIICKKHGEFQQVATVHSKGHGCCRCSGENSNKERSSRCKHEFVEKAKRIHGDKYLYSKVEYIKAVKKVVITCRIHGDFSQTPNSHLCGNGCIKCRGLKTSERNRIDTQEFIKRARRIHGETYGYDEVEYVNSITEVSIVCKRHGEFRQTPNVHLDGCGCPACGDVRSADGKRSNTEDFIRKALEVHGNKYDYSVTEYKGTNYNKVAINCKKHGTFYQSPSKHLSGCGCRRCGINLSFNEQNIRRFLSEFFTVSGGDRKILNGKEIDILLPDKQVGIEYNGTVWHSERYSKDPIWHMRNKQLECERAGIRLIHVNDHENMVIVKKTLVHILGIDQEKYYARSCKVHVGRSTDQQLALFFDSHHLQGNAVGCWVGYLTHNGAIVCAAAFSRPASVRGSKSDSLWELRRFASCCRVVGGASRLLKLFIRTHPECERIVSYSDNRWFTGSMYERLGFQLEKELPPDYKYHKNGVIEPKNHFKRSAMAKRPDFDFRPEETEHQNCLRNGWYRIYDCGKKRWALDIKNPDR